jgi:dienelactone hydrolase
VEHEALAAHIADLDAAVLPASERESLARMLADDLRLRREAANRRDAEAWSQVRTRADWEAFCTPRIAALRASLGDFPTPPDQLQVRVTGSVNGAGFRIENLVYESRPGVSVPANLYLPDPPQERTPAFLLIHSHHNPKTQGELQDMGMTWARQGCAVLVMDQFGHGERRQHPEGPRQDYRFRAVTGLQIQLLGDSLMGWMVWDVMGGIDLLTQRPDIDRDKIILIGSVAGGGDPAAVTAALDARVAAVIPFNFGGPQPETAYPLPTDAEATFDYMGRGSWESTRNLRLSGRDGFLPWVIVASVAPRRLIYAHEFRWDQERDPVWRRLQQVYALYDAPGHLDCAHGAGELSGRPPEATHCNNVGAPHRAMIHPTLQRWFGIPIPEPEYSQRLPAEQLHCLPPRRGAELPLGDPSRSPDPTPPPATHDLFHTIGSARAAAARAQRAYLTLAEQRERLRDDWARLLGDIAPRPDFVVQEHQTDRGSGFLTERIVLAVEPGIRLPLLLLLPPAGPPQRLIVAVAQEGKSAFLRHRTHELACLLNTGTAVCLPDLRGTGETSPGPSRERQSPATSLSATEWMLGQTLLGSRLRDLRTLLRYLETRTDLLLLGASNPALPLVLWGDSFAAVNTPGFPDPLLGESEAPPQSEPMGGLLALLGALYEDRVAAAIACGTLASYQSVLENQFCYVPHDAIVPAALTAGDLCDVAAVLSPRPVWLEGLVDGRNCRVPEAELKRIFATALVAYDGVEGPLDLVADPIGNIWQWLGWVLWIE